MCNGATFSAPTVTIDCKGNRSCQDISFDKDVVETITLTCGPFGPGPEGKIDENFVCKDMKIPEEAECTCISIAVIDEENPKADTSCPSGCCPPGGCVVV